MKTQSPNNLYKIGEYVAIDEYTEAKVVGYEFADRPGSNYPYKSHAIWWDEKNNCWLMTHPTDHKKAPIPVPDEIKVSYTLDLSAQRPARTK